MSSVTLILLIALAGVAVYVVRAYNRLVGLKHHVNVAWSNIDVLLKQRHDELPRLVTTCREYVHHEQETFENVLLARAQVSDAMQSECIAELSVAESFMSKALGGLFVLTESYPELKSDDSFLRLKNRVSSLENAIADRREYYNDSANINNVLVAEFPTIVVADLFKFGPVQLFTVDGHELTDVSLEALFTV